MKICNFPFIHFLKQLKSLDIILKLFLIFKILSCSAPLHPEVEKTPIQVFSDVFSVAVVV